MPRGGKRRGTGRPKGSGDRREPTKTVRVPISFAEKIPELLKKHQEEEEVGDLQLPGKQHEERLPLESLAWDAFEAFCLDFISRYLRPKECHHYGTQGDNQLGIDLVAELENGEKWVFQCKQWQKFNRSDAEKVIQETTYSADCYVLLLSREASRTVRDVIEAHPKWAVWDVRGISQKVRELPIEVARRLVRDHFHPEWQNAFLGVSGLTPFISPEDFFHDSLNSDEPFNHAWELVGREESLKSLNQFVESSQKQVAILPGRGGIGKTKLLHAFAEKFALSNFLLRFVEEGVPITTENSDNLPASPCVVVLDDAHRREEDLSVLLALVRQRSNIKLILSSRPHAVEYLKVRLRQAGIGSGQISQFDELKALIRDDVKVLARQALGIEYAHFAEQLASLTRDCPLVTVVGGGLLVERKIPLRLLERNEDFQYYVLKRFYDDVLSGKISHRIEPALCKRLLELIAAVAPIRLTNELFQQIAAEFLKIERRELVTSIGILEQSGVLLRRGYALRITPDVLSDHILHEACLTPQGESTGYAREVFDKFKPICPTEVLRNLAELDWRIRHTSDKETNLLTDIWHSIREEFEKASNFDRCQLLDLLKQVAYYQPEPTLELVKFAMRNPATHPEDESLSLIYRYTHDNVLSKLPDILQRISYTFNYLLRCCDLLWELRRRHGIGVLKEIAGYDIYKPVEVNKTVLEAVSRWLKTHYEHDDICSLLDILDPLLAKSSYSEIVEEHQITFIPFVVSKENTQYLRERGLQLISDCATSENLNVVLRAFKSLENALRKPIVFFNLEITFKEQEQWVSEQFKVLKLVSTLVEKITNPVVHFKVIEILCLHTRYNSSEEVKEKAKSIISSIPKSYELKLIGALRHSANWDWLLDQGESTEVNYEKREQRAKEMCLALAREFLQRHSDANEGVQILNEGLQSVINGGTQPGASSFLCTLSQVEPSYAARMCEAIIEEPNSPLAAFLDLLLYGVMIENTDHAVTIARRAVENGDPNLCRAIAAWYWNIDLTKKLLSHTDLTVKALAISSLVTLRNSEPRLAVAAALTVDIGDSTELASKLCEVFDPEYGITPNALTDEELETLLGKLEPIADIEDDDISQFLAYASERLPRSVIQLLLKRIERDEKDNQGNYQPLPDYGFQHRLNGLAASEEYENILRHIREQALKRTHHPHFWLPRLFEEASLGFNSTSLKVLEEWINSGNAEKIKAVSLLLCGANQAFVFMHVEFVKNLLEKAYALGDECYQRVSFDLFGIATSGIRSGSVGQPFPEDVALRDQSAAVAERFSVGSLSHQFYDSLAKHAASAISRK